MQGVVGYTPGVFDLFHVGHLDVLRRAGELCDHLVVGVFTDELAERLRGVRPVVPLIERMEIVGNVRHVDRVVPLEEAALRTAWESLGFDVVFTGPSRPGVPEPEAVERELAGTGVRAVRFTGLTGTQSPVLRECLSLPYTGDSAGAAPQTPEALRDEEPPARPRARRPWQAETSVA
jgi:glycerol-3-phosphate cytidylyltransferase